MTDESKLNSLIGSMFAEIYPEEKIARCPKCNGRLLAHVTVYLNVPVRVKHWKRDNQTRTEYAAADFVETRKEVQRLIAEEYNEAETDERDEFQCEQCDYICNWEALAN
jgi:DNA-directed RNA polymerase subunit RPC12/RpoP